MYKSLIGEKVTVIISSRGDHLLEYIGTLSSESDDSSYQSQEGSKKEEENINNEIENK